MAALEVEHDSGVEVHRNAIHGNDGAGVRVSSRAWVKVEGNEIHGRGLHSFISQLNLSRVCHKKTPYTP
jgi:hypothetical protein